MHKFKQIIPITKDFSIFAPAMADGYLENRMAQHRATAMRAAASGKRRNALDCAMPEKRVIIIGSITPLTAALIKIYAESGCRVALFTDCSAETLPSDCRGVRIIDASSVTSVSDLLEVWHDIDIIAINHIEVHLCGMVDDIIKHIGNARKKLPLPNSYGLRIIRINLYGTSPTAIKETPIRPTVNTISTTGNSLSADTINAIARTSLYLSLPWAGCIDGSKIIIKSRNDE